MHLNTSQIVTLCICLYVSMPVYTFSSCRTRVASGKQGAIIDDGAASGIDRVEMLRRLNTAVPPGTSVENATATLANNGFTCTIMENAAFSECDGAGNCTVLPADDFLYADREDCISFGTAVRWQAALYFKNGRIIRICVSRGITGF